MNIDILRNADKDKNDNLVILYKDIESEVIQYKEQLENKIIYCSFSNPKFSNFYQYFKDNFHNLKLKKLISTYTDIKSFKIEYNGLEEVKVEIEEKEFIFILKECDIVICNPPLSLFKDYSKLLIENNKKFLIIGLAIAHSTKHFFNYLYNKKVWLGYKGRINDILNTNGDKIHAGITWWTNLNVLKDIDFIFVKKYNEEEYPKFDYYDAINVNRGIDIPYDYYGKMAVPVTFLEHLNPDEFEIIDMLNSTTLIEEKKDKTKDLLMLNGKRKFQRLIIKRKENKK